MAAAVLEEIMMALQGRLEQLTLEAEAAVAVAPSLTVEQAAPASSS